MRFGIRGEVAPSLCDGGQEHFRSERVLREGQLVPLQQVGQPDVQCIVGIRMVLFERAAAGHDLQLVVHFLIRHQRQGAIVLYRNRIQTALEQAQFALQAFLQGSRCQMMEGVTIVLEQIADIETQVGFARVDTGFG